jgi:hypothetical protein
MKSVSIGMVGEVKITAASAFPDDQRRLAGRLQEVGDSTDADGKSRDFKQ